MRGAIPRKLGWMRGASQATGVGSIPDSHEGHIFEEVKLKGNKVSS